MSALQCLQPALSTSPASAACHKAHGQPMRLIGLTFARDAAPRTSSDDFGSLFLQFILKPYEYLNSYSYMFLAFLYLMINHKLFLVKKVTGDRHNIRCLEPLPASNTMVKRPCCPASVRFRVGLLQKPSKNYCILCISRQSHWDTAFPEHCEYEIFQNHGEL